MKNRILSALISSAVMTLLFCSSASAAWLYLKTDGNGTVSTNPQGTENPGGTNIARAIYFYNDQTVQLTATPNAGYVFQGWSGVCSGATNPISVSMDTSKECIANFNPGDATGTSTATNTSTGTATNTATNTATGTATGTSGNTSTSTATGTQNNMAMVDAGLNIHVPSARYRPLAGSDQLAVDFSFDLAYIPTFDGQLLWKLSAYDICDNCSTSNMAEIASNLDIHIPSIQYTPPTGNAMNIMVELAFVPTDDGALWWTLKNVDLCPGCNNGGNTGSTGYTANCGDTIEASGDASETHIINMNANSGQFSFEYHTYSVKDRLIIEYEGSPIYNTGCVGTQMKQKVSLDFNGASSNITVRVDPNCGDFSGTRWDFRLSCPQGVAVDAGTSGTSSTGDTGGSTSLSNPIVGTDDLGVTYSLNTEPDIALALVAETGDGVLGIFGNKDVNGRLISVNGFTFTDKNDVTQTVTIELGANYLPAKIIFPDNSSVDFSNYTNDGATLRYHRPDGTVVNQTTVSLPMEKARAAADAIRKYTESPQPTNETPIPSLPGKPTLATDSDCLEVMKAFHATADNMIWGALQLANIVSCATAGATAVLTGGIAIPMAVWACSSVILNGVDHLAKALTNDNSPFKGLNEWNSRLSGAAACARGNIAGCSLGIISHFADGVLEALEPEKLCNSQQCQDRENPTLEQWCADNNGTWSSGIQSCSIGVSSIGAVDRDAIAELADQCDALADSCIHMRGTWAFSCDSTLICDHRQCGVEI